MSALNAGIKCGVTAPVEQLHKLLSARKKIEAPSVFWWWRDDDREKSSARGSFRPQSLATSGHTSYTKIRNKQQLHNEVPQGKQWNLHFYSKTILLTSASTLQYVAHTAGENVAGELRFSSCPTLIFDVIDINLLYLCGLLGFYNGCALEQRPLTFFPKSSPTSNSTKLLYFYLSRFFSNGNFHFLLQLFFIGLLVLVS